MSIAQVTSDRKEYLTDGVITALSYPYPFTAKTDLTVTERIIATGADTLLVLTTDYTVSATNDDYSSGATVTLTSVKATGSRIIIERAEPSSQNITYTEASKFPANNTQNALDKLTRLVQQFDTELLKCLRVPMGDMGDNTIPNEITRAGKFLGFDEDGNPTASLNAAATLPQAVTVEQYTDWQTAITTLNAAPLTPVTLLHTQAYTATANVTVLDHITLWFLDYGSINNSGFDITVEGAVQASQSQYIFQGTGAWTLKNMQGVVYPEWFGASTVVGETDDSGPAINKAIQAVFTSGGTVHFAPKTYYTNEEIVLRSGVSLVGASKGTRITAALTGSIIQAGATFPTSTPMISNLVTGATPADDQFNMQILNLAIRGVRLTAATNVEKIIHFTNIRSLLIENCYIEECLKEAILIEDATSQISQLKDLVIVNAVTDTGLAADTGAITLDGGFDNWLVNVECGTSSAGVEVEGGKRIALLLKGNAANNFIFGGQYEFSEVGVKLASGSNRNQFTNVRADKNTRHGFWIIGGENVFSSCQALNNSFEVSNTYNGFENEGLNNMYAACIAKTNIANTQKYGFHNSSAASASTGPKFVGCTSVGHGTLEFLDDNDAWAWETGRVRQLNQTTQDATPTILDARTLVLVSGGTTRDEITNLDDTVRGQVVSLVSNAGNQFFPYIKPSSTFRLAKPFYPSDNNDCIHLQNSGTASVPLWNEMGRSDQGMIHSCKCLFDASLTINGVDRQTQASHQIGIIPDNSVIIRAIMNVITAPTGAGCNLGFGIATDHALGIIANTAVASFTTGLHYNTSGLIIPLVTDDTTWTTKTTGVRDIICTVDNADLTNAARIELFLEYIQDSS